MVLEHVAALLNCDAPVFVSLSCLLYKHVPLDGFSSALGSQGTLSSRSRRRRRRQAHVRRPTPNHPEMAVLSGRQVQSEHLIGFINSTTGQTLDFASVVVLQPKYSLCGMKINGKCFECLRSVVKPPTQSARGPSWAVRPDLGVRQRGGRCPKPQHAHQ